MKQPPATTTPATALQGRVAIVTGASRGIGRAIALHLASLGAKIVINHTSPSSLPLDQQLIFEINSLQHFHSTNAPCAIAMQDDVSDEAQVRTLFTTLEQTFSTQPHILVTSAGVLDPTLSPLSLLDAAQFDLSLLSTHG
ncbi:NADPH-dependent aldehyde reductase-like protein chloroplastic [Bienertia sinuspersici]